MLEELVGYSRANGFHVLVVRNIVQSFLRNGVPCKDLAIITYYSAQKRLYELLLGAMNVIALGNEPMSVDSSQGREFPLLFVDTVTPGNAQYPIGFVGDPRRMNVGMTRAQDGLVFISSADIGTGQRYRGVGESNWVKLVAHHRQQSTLYQENPIADKVIVDFLAVRGVTHKTHRRVNGQS